MKRRIERLEKLAAKQAENRCESRNDAPTLTLEQLQAMTFEESVRMFEGEEALLRFQNAPIAEQVRMLREWCNRCNGIGN